MFEIAKKPPNQELGLQILEAFSAILAKKVNQRNYRFNFDRAKHLFGEINHPDYDNSAKKIEQCFQFSMMTVLDESHNMSKYSYLSFVEFLDMLCRICIICVSRVDTLENKCHWLLTIIYD